MRLIHSEDHMASVQTISTLFDNHQALVLGLNNSVSLSTFSLLANSEVEIQAKQSKPCGSFVIQACVQGSQVIVGDVMKGVKIFDVVMQNQQYILAEGPSSKSMSIWVNTIVPLAQNKFMVSDKERNMFIFERHMKPR